MAIQLPSWAERHPAQANTILVDPDKFYPEILGELRQAALSMSASRLDELGAFPTDVAILQGNNISKYWIEVAFQCMKLELQTALRRYNFSIHLRGDDGRSQRWGLRYHPGTDADVARADRAQQARAWFRVIRGFLPA